MLNLTRCTRTPLLLLALLAALSFAVATSISLTAGVAPAFACHPDDNPSNDPYMDDTTGDGGCDIEPSALIITVPEMNDKMAANHVGSTLCNARAALVPGGVCEAYPHVCTVHPIIKSVGTCVVTFRTYAIISDQVDQCEQIVQWTKWGYGYGEISNTYTTQPQCQPVYTPLTLDQTSAYVQDKASEACSATSGCYDNAGNCTPALQSGGPGTLWSAACSVSIWVTSEGIYTYDLTVSKNASGRIVRTTYISLSPRFEPFTDG